MARKSSRNAFGIDEISYDYEIEENNFEEVITGTPVANFYSAYPWGVSE